jgi:hypothetical protein
MIDVRIALRAILLADPAVAAACGGRIYPAVLPQGVTAPSIVQNLITEDISYHMQGDSGLMVSRTQLDSWAVNPDDAVKLGNAVFDRLSGFKDAAFPYTVNGQPVTVDIVVLHAQGQDAFDTTARLHSRQRDFFVWYRVR